jgi:hypothetical protein
VRAEGQHNLLDTLLALTTSVRDHRHGSCPNPALVVPDGRGARRGGRGGNPTADL